MPRLITALATGLLLAACGGATPPTGTTPPGATTPGSSATASLPVTPGTSPTVGATGGGIIGPLFTGSLAQAFPPLIGGEQVQVVGPVPGTEMENLDATTLSVIQEMGFEPAGVEVAFATDSGATVYIFGMRFPGVASTTIDSTYIAVQDAAPGTANFRVVTIAGRNVHAFDTIFGTTYSWVNGDILFTIPLSSATGAEQAIASMPPPTVALVAGGGTLARVVIDLSIVGGPDAGDYHGETSSGGCTRNALGENQFGLQYTDDANADGFTSMQMVVEDATAAEAGGTEEFFATLNIGPMFGGSSYNVDPADGDGTGTVAMASTGSDSATVDVTGETADGVAFEATVTCNVIFDFGGG